MPRRPGPALTRDDVVEAALRCVERDGADALGVRSVARELGIAAPSVLYYLDGNEALRRAVALEGWRRLADALEGDADLRAVARAYRAFARRHPSLYEVLSTTRLDDDADAAAARDRLLERFRRLVPGDGAHAVHALRALRAALHGFVQLEASGQLGLAVSVEASFEWLIEGLAPLVGRRSSPPPAARARRR